jgi:prophage regulatory protein
MVALAPLRRIYRKKQLPEVTGLKSSSIEDLIAKGQFPKPVKLTDSGRAVGWLESDLLEWQQSLKRAG